ncbi:hypothetical protein NPIL_61711 [Nephila pilipes]|uniref:Uncharacterized protein n=1 Tax=Nephila pilipes TaxID=299642 RepID=A0A8X6UGI7_NEPPI|nr:hypothetical protein NPIL_61711 [Nephila pilipes]
MAQNEPHGMLHKAGKSAHGRATDDSPKEDSNKDTHTPKQGHFSPKSDVLFLKSDDSGGGCDERHAGFPLHPATVFVKRNSGVMTSGTLMEAAVDSNAVCRDLEEKECMVSAAQEKEQTFLFVGELVD